MSQNCNNGKKTAAQWLDWSAKEMKRLANETRDPTVKNKLQQIAGIDRQYRDKLGFVNKSGEDKGIKKEIEILKSAFFCQQSVFREFSLYPVNENSSLMDEIADAKKTMVRDLYSEIAKRDAVL